jgi:orotidine-5'-phosphate decarboxylase
MFDVHAMGGAEMMQAAATASRKEASDLGIVPPAVLGVTILTSIDKRIMNDELRINGDVEDQVVHLAKLADDAGLDGVIASPHEIQALRAKLPRRMLIVTPGVRPTWAASDDQRRFMTPGEAIERGASYVVIGRPITKPPAGIGTPVQAADRVRDEISSVVSKWLRNVQ